MVYDYSLAALIINIVVMKTRILLLATLLNCFSICLGQERLDINTSESNIKWSGEYSFYFGGHEGNINFKEGYFIKSGEIITGGEFIIDMHSIVCTDNGKIDRDSGLVGHLKNEDFFEVETYPISKLIIKSVEYQAENWVKIYADLTIKGITLPINFRAEMDYKNKSMKTRFKIDRQRWGIDYNSSLRDSAISDAIGFEVVLSL